MRLREFAPAGGGGSGNYFQALASAWYNGVFDTGSLQKGIKSQQDVERLLNRGIVAPDGKMRKYHIDYNSDFDGVEIYSDDYYEYGDHDDTIDSRTGQKWGPYDFMAFSDEQLDESAKYRDPKYKGQLYTQEPPDYMDTREYDRAMFDPKPDNYPGRKELPGGGEYDRTDPLVRGAGIGRSGIKNNILDRGKRKGLPSRDQITSLKQSIRDISGRHTRANLPKESVNEFAADDGDSGGEDDALHKYAQMWWAGDEATQMQIEKVLDRMGWEIGEDEGGYDNGGVFVVRAGDENGDSYTSWAAEDLTEGVAEGSEDPFGPQGRFVGDTGPAQLTTTVPRVQLQIGDRVIYKPTEQRARIEAMSRDGTQARIHIPSPMGGKTFNCKTSDLKALGALKEKSTSQAQFRTMAAAAHDPKFARKVGIKQSVAREFNKADKGQSYKSLPKRAD